MLNRVRSTARNVEIEQDWVEVSWTLLTPADRTSARGQDTTTLPYVARVRGWTLGRARVGCEAVVTTLSGRRVQGEVIEILPGYTHTFGSPPPAWLTMRQAIREQLRTL